jgi:hypothetical protein
MTSRLRHRGTALVGVALAVVLTAGSAQGAVPYKQIASAGPLTEVSVGNDLSCQVAYSGDSQLELFPASVKPGDCGTFVATADALFAPNFAAHDSTASSGLGAFTPLTPVSQSQVSGQGTGASPYRVSTVVDVGTTGLRVTQVDSYVTGQEAYRTDVTVLNQGGAPFAGVLYRAGDCYLQESDTGFGFVDEANRAVGCSRNANNTPAARIEQWFPLTAGNTFMEARYSEVWAHIATRQPFANTTRAGESIDNGAGISWALSVASGAQQTFSHYTTFSPTGVTGPPGGAAAPSAAFGRNGLLESPPVGPCVSKRYFRIKLRSRYQPIIAAVTVKLRGLTKVLRRPPWGTNVDLRGLPRGTFKVRITALTVTGRTIRGTRTYRTCRGRLTGGIPRL